ncbi:MAG: hypothetical protein ABII13_01390 [Patescibacteria group bacterium]
MDKRDYGFSSPLHICEDENSCSNMASPDKKRAGCSALPGAQGCEWVRLPPMPPTAGPSLDVPAIPWIFEGSSLLKIHVDYSSI